MKNNKKGFTLIELLAVIVILALLVGVGILSITRYLNTSRKGTMVASAAEVVEAVRKDVLTKGLT